MSRRLALVYGTQGPWVSTSLVRQPTLRITGLLAGTVRVHIPGCEPLDFGCDGRHTLPVAAWMRCEYVGEGQGPICVITERAA